MNLKLCVGCYVYSMINELLFATMYKATVWICYNLEKWSEETKVELETSYRKLQYSVQSVCRHIDLIMLISVAVA